MIGITMVNTICKMRLLVTIFTDLFLGINRIRVVPETTAGKQWAEVLRSGIFDCRYYRICQVWNALMGRR